MNDNDAAAIAAAEDHVRACLIIAVLPRPKDCGGRFDGCSAGRRGMEGPYVVDREAIDGAIEGQVALYSVPPVVPCCSP